MTNTPTWDIKPIALPKINANLLSLISLVLLLTMAFMMVHPAIASHCEELANKAIFWAGAALVAATLATYAAKALHMAMGSLNPWAIAAASAAFLVATGAAAIAAARAVEYAKKLYECEKSHDSASGGCDSGSCDSG